MAFKKIDKPFLLTDSTVNMYGYRLLTSGYLLAQYQKNPIGYHMHGKPENTDYTRKDGVLVKWEDFELIGDEVWAKPCINLEHPRGEKTAKEVEEGFLNAASLGHFVVLEVSTDEKDYLPGQTGPTISKWYNREASLVDIPGNYNALASLYDEAGNELNLQDLIAKSPIINKEKMIQIKFSEDQLKLIDLNATSTDTEVSAKLQELVAKASMATAAEAALSAFKKEAGTAKINDLVCLAVKEGKLTVAAGDKLKVDYAENPTGLEALIAALPKYKSIAEQIEETGDGSELKDLTAKSYDELDVSGKLERLKALDGEAFKAKFKKQFGRDYNGK
jgi:hypothetical protein